MAIPNVAAGELIESAWGNQVGDEIDEHTATLAAHASTLAAHGAQLPAKTKVLTPTTIAGGGAIANGETRKLCDIAVGDPGFSGVVKFYIEGEASGSAGDGTLQLQIRNAAGTVLLVDGMHGSYFAGRATQHTFYGGLAMVTGVYYNVTAYAVNAGVSVNVNGRVYVEIIPD